MLLAFAVQGAVQHFMEIGFFGRFIIANYLFNYGLTILFFAALIYFQKKQTVQLGFVFLFSSLAKFVLFFALLLPGYGMGEDIDKAKIAPFFIPYSIALFMEINYLVRLLNRQ